MTETPAMLDTLRSLQRALALLGVVVLLLLGLLVLSFWVLRLTAPAPEPRQGWTLGPELPMAFGELATVALTGDDGEERLVVLSGLAGLGRVLDDVFVLNPRGGSWVWERAPSLPRPRHHTAAAALDGAVVVAGGAETLGEHPWTGTRDVWRWRPGGEWQALPSLPEARWGHRMVEHGGRLYVIGGHGESGSTFIYRPDHEGWAVAAPLPEPRDHLSVVVVEGRIWAIGGRSPDSVARVDIFDPGMETWQPGPSLPQPTSGAAEGVVDGRIHVLGGEEPAFRGGGIIDRHWVLDTRETPLSWQLAESPPLTVHGADGAVFQGRLVIAGGASRHGARSVTAWTPLLQMMTAE